MSILTAVGQRLGWKLLLSYLVIVVVGMVVLIGTAELQIPAALARHTVSMQALVGDDPALAADLHDSVRTALNEVISFAALAGLLASIIISVFTARRIVGPVQDMVLASRSIAAGEYHQRVKVPGRDELGTLAQSFNQMAATLEQTEQRRMELIGNVAHELRTPLASIRSVMEGLIDGVMPADQDAFVAVQGEVIRLQRLVGDLQELSRAEAGQIALDMKPVSPAELIQAVAGHLTPQFQDKGVSLRLELPPGLPLVRADAGRITQVLTNLLGNALQYTPGGGSVTMRADAHAHDVIFTVQDTGIGMAAEHLPHVFERFYRVDKSRSRAGGGSGIGLTIAKYLIERHGGRIAAHSAGPGEGSTFTFTLPRAP